jgi:hypothetical protein
LEKESTKPSGGGSVGIGASLASSGGPRKLATNGRPSYSAPASAAN